MVVKKIFFSFLGLGMISPIAMAQNETVKIENVLRHCYKLVEPKFENAELQSWFDYDRGCRYEGAYHNQCFWSWYKFNYPYQIVKTVRVVVIDKNKPNEPVYAENQERVENKIQEFTDQWSSKAQEPIAKVKDTLARKVNIFRETYGAFACP